jgi:serine/threonine protein kinase
MLDHYKTLNVDPLASPEVVTAAYKALMKKHNGGDKRTLQNVNEAYSVVGEAAARAEYDKHRLPAGKTLGSYRLIEKIAEGGFGATWRAEHTATKSPVCVKHALEVSPEDERFLIDEARKMWDLRHYGIPAVRDLVRGDDGRLHLVMSYIPGPTLAQVIEKNYPKGMDPEHVAWIAERVLNVLKYLHTHGVVHGDMKPQNIIVEPERHTVVVVDYGLSVVRPTHKTEAAGYTPYFCAPEQENWQPPIPETDLYGLGMSMIFALGGDVANKTVSDRTPAAMLSLIKRMIRIDPMKRPRVWDGEDLCQTISEARKQDFGRTASGMKPLKVG